jgi:hypothetical protein
MNFPVTLNLNISERELRKEIMRNMKVRLDKRLSSIADKLSKVVGKMFIQQLRASPEYQSLVTPNGRLRLEFGIEQPEYVMTRLTKLIGDMFKVKYQKPVSSSNVLFGAIVVSFDRDPEKIYNLVQVSYPTVNGRRITRKDRLGSYPNRKSLGKERTGLRGRPAEKFEVFNIDWLKWLLTSGAEPVIFGYRVKFGNFPTSRTGQAIMVPKNGGAWGVPAEFAGTANDNWITRNLDLFRPKIEEIINSMMKGLADDDRNDNLLNALVKFLGKGDGDT